MIKKTILVTGLLIIFLLFLSCKNTKTTSNNQKNEIVEKTATATKVDEKFPTTNIKEGQKILSPITITVNSEGVWFASEGDLGTVKIVDDKNNILNIKGDVGLLFTVDGNWMHNDPAFFKTTITFDKKNAKKGKIIFYSNPGEGEGDEAGTMHSFEIPVTF